MSKTTAKVEHRDYIPWGWIAIKFCDVEFYGSRAAEMSKKWQKIKSERYEKYDSLCKENEMKIEAWRTLASSIRDNVKNSKPFYRFWYNKSEKDMLATAAKHLSQANELEEENEKVKANRFFETFECRMKIEELLRQNGFILTNASSRGKECITKIEIWTLEE